MSVHALPLDSHGAHNWRTGTDPLPQGSGVGQLAINRVEIDPNKPLHEQLEGYPKPVALPPLVSEKPKRACLDDLKARENLALAINAQRIAVAAVASAIEALASGAALVDQARGKRDVAQAHAREADAGYESAILAAIRNGLTPPVRDAESLEDIATATTEAERELASYEAAHARLTDAKDQAERDAASTREHVEAAIKGVMSVTADAAADELAEAEARVLRLRRRLEHMGGCASPYASAVLAADPCNPFHRAPANVDPIATAEGEAVAVFEATLATDWKAKL